MKSISYTHGEDGGLSAVSGTLSTENSIGRTGNYYLPEDYNLSSRRLLLASRDWKLRLQHGECVFIARRKAQVHHCSTWDSHSRPQGITLGKLEQVLEKRRKTTRMR